MLVKVYGVNMTILANLMVERKEVGFSMLSTLTDNILV
jgi:hypothetical protein